MYKRPTLGEEEMEEIIYRWAYEDVIRRKSPS